MNYEGGGWRGNWNFVERQGKQIFSGDRDVQDWVIFSHRVRFIVDERLPLLLPVLWKIRKEKAQAGDEVRTIISSSDITGIATSLLLLPEQSHPLLLRVSS